MKYTVILRANPEENTPEEMETFKSTVDPNGYPCDGLFTITFAGERMGIRTPNKIFIMGASDVAIAGALMASREIRSVVDFVVQERLEGVLNEMLGSVTGLQ